MANRIQSKPEPKYATAMKKGGHVYIVEFTKPKLHACLSVAFKWALNPEFNIIPEDVAEMRKQAHAMLKGEVDRECRAIRYGRRQDAARPQDRGAVRR